jgi:hypothetical protein
VEPHLLRPLQLAEIGEPTHVDQSVPVGEDDFAEEVTTELEEAMAETEREDRERLGGSSGSR